MANGEERDGSPANQADSRHGPGGLGAPGLARSSAENILRMALDAIDEPILVVMPDYRVLHANRAARDAAPHRGHGEGSLHCYEASHHRDTPCDGAADPCPLRQVFESRRPTRATHTHYDAQGRATRVDVHAFPILDEQGRVAAVVESVRDVTERERNEARLRKSAEVARAAADAQSEFLARVSHEIRTPLTGIIGMNELLLTCALDPEPLEYAERIASSSESLLSIVNDVLDFSKIQAGRLELERSPVDIRTILEEVGDAVAARAQRKGVEYVTCVGPDLPPWLWGDPLRLHQVLLNLAGNAVKFTEHGEVVVTATPAPGQRRDHRTCHLHVSVRDTGIGIPEERSRDIFDPFSQVEPSLTRKYGGTGLGLTIVHQLVELMGGEVNVHSGPEPGSEFWFWLELPVAPAPEGSASAGEAGEEAAPARGCSRALIVDPRLSSARALRLALEAVGVRSAVVANVPEARRQAGESPPEAGREETPWDIAFVDSAVPPAEARSLAEELAGAGGEAAVPLVLVHPVTEPIGPDGLQAEGFSALLSKPLQLRRLRRCLKEARGTAPPPGSPAGDEAEAPRGEQGSGAPARRLLLAEDNPTNQEVLSAILRKHGYRIDCAPDGAKALEALAADRYDLVLMDVDMPEIDGLEATRRLRASPECFANPDVPVVAMTAHALAGDRERCLKAGMDDYVSKPVRVKDLLSAIERSLSRGGHAGRRHEAGEDLPARLATATIPSSPPPVAAPVDFDRDELLRRLGGDEAILRELREQFIVDAERHLDRLTDHVEEPRTETTTGEAREQAQALASAAGSCEARRLESLAIRLREELESPRREACRGTILEARKALEAFRSAVR